MRRKNLQKKWRKESAMHLLYIYTCNVHVHNVYILHVHTCTCIMYIGTVTKDVNSSRVTRTMYDHNKSLLPL